MFKLIMIGVVLAFLFTTSSAFSQVETYEDAIPVLKEIGEKLFLTINSSVDYIKEIVDVWSVEVESVEVE